MKQPGWSSWYNTALEFYKNGRLKESRKLLVEIQKSSPGYVPALDLLSIIDFKLKNYEKTEYWTKQLLRYVKDNPDYINRYAMVLFKEDKIGEAGKVVKKGRGLDSKHPGLIYNDIIFHLKIGLSSQVEELLKQIPPDHALFEKSKKHIANFVEKRQILNSSLKQFLQAENWVGAINTYSEWLKENSPTSDSFYNLGLLYMKVGNHTMAIHYFSKCYACDPPIAPAVLLYLWYNKLMICEWGGYESAAKEITEAAHQYLDSPAPDYDLPVYILSYFDVDGSLFAKCGTKIYERIKKKVQIPLRQTIKPDRGEVQQRIRIGYLSSAFYEHPVGRVYQDIFALHNRDDFEVFVYTTNAIQDHVSQKIANGADTYRNIASLDTQKAYKLIYDDHLDILMTVGGHGDDMNMELVAMKPAPIIINLHGYNESLGGRFVDYILSDKEVLTDNIRENFMEKVIYFPHCSLISSTIPEAVIKNKHDFGIPPDSFVFLSAAHPRKITSEIFDLWRKILINTDKTVLLILDFGIPEVKENLIKYLDNKELENRVYFSGRISYREHLGRYHIADLLLDTPIYNCHSIGIEALRSGLPFITLKGNNTNSRFGRSMLKTMGISELICRTEEEYIRKAVEFSTDFSLRNKLKRKIMNSTKLFDAKKNVELIENGYQKVLKRYIENKPFVDVFLDYD